MFHIAACKVSRSCSHCMTYWVALQTILGSAKGAVAYIMGGTLLLDGNNISSTDDTAVCTLRGRAHGARAPFRSV
jgi:hypothetical protein